MHSTPLVPDSKKQFRRIKNIQENARIKVSYIRGRTRQPPQIQSDSVLLLYWNTTTLDYTFWRSFTEQKSLIVSNTCHTPWLSGTCQIFSVKSVLSQSNKLCDTGLLSTKVCGTSRFLIHPVGDTVSISQAILSLLPCVHRSHPVILHS